MVHTAKLYIILEQRDIFKLEEKFNENITLISCILDKRFKGITTTFIKKCHEWFGFITIDFIQLLDKPTIEEKDYEQVECKLNNFLKMLGVSIDDLILIRIDYRLDVKVKSKIEREVLFHLYKKLIEKYRFKKKYDQYKSTIYFNSKSIQATAYDKEEERNSKGQYIKNYEENILRFEVRLQNRHLNYIKRQYKMEKRLKSYFKNNLYKKYMKENLECLLYMGDYYKLYMAEKIINSSILKERKKIFLREFLVEVSKNNINGAMLKHSKYKFRQALKLLEALDINPIMIPKNWKCPSIIENPFNIN